MDETLAGWVEGLRLGVLDSEFRPLELERAEGCTQDKFLREHQGPSLIIQKYCREKRGRAVTNYRKT